MKLSLNAKLKLCVVFSALLLVGDALIAQNSVPSGGAPITVKFATTDPVPGTPCTYPGGPAVQTSNTASGPQTLTGNQGYARFLWNGYTGNLSACVAPSGSTPGVPFTMVWAAVINGGGFVATLGPAIASATTIAPTYKITHITGTTPIATITSPTGIVSGSTITLIFDGVATWTAAGNIAVAGTPTTAGSAVTFTWDAATAKWYPSRLA